jgi:hypothetical protein
MEFVYNELIEERIKKNKEKCKHYYSIENFEGTIDKNAGEDIAYMARKVRGKGLRPRLPASRSGV